MTYKAGYIVTSTEKKRKLFVMGFQFTPTVYWASLTRWTPNGFECLGDYSFQNVMDESDGVVEAMVAHNNGYIKII